MACAGGQRLRQEIAGQVRGQGGQASTQDGCHHWSTCAAASAFRRPAPAASPVKCGARAASAHARQPPSSMALCSGQAPAPAESPVKCGARTARASARVSSRLMASAAASAPRLAWSERLAGQLRRQDGQGLPPDHLIADGHRRGQRLVAARRSSAVPGSARALRAIIPMIDDGLRRGQRISQCLFASLAGQLRCQERPGPAHDCPHS